MNSDLFECGDYKDYLRNRLDNFGPQRGARTLLAQKLKCQTAFISQVLNGSAHLSLEHAAKVNEFLNHSIDQCDFFILLVLKSKAGNKSLKDYVTKKLAALLEEKKKIESRIPDKTSLTHEHASAYYSSWHYAAIHILISIPEFRSSKMIAYKLSLDQGQVNTYLDQLESMGLVAKNPDGTYEIKNTRVHIGTGSPNLLTHHTNWRLKAIDTVHKRNKSDLHYSMVVSLSRQDTLKLRSMVLDLVEKSEGLIKKSPEEVLLALTLDMFEI